MNPPTNRNPLMALYVVATIIIIVCFLSIFSSILATQTTGTLKVISSDKQATVSISQPNHQAKFLGVGKASVRLAPGSYQVAVSNNGKEAVASVDINKKQATNLSLSPSQAVLLPSVQSVSFKNISSFLNFGLTTDQLSDLEHAFFKFKPVAGVVSIDPASIEPGPYDPNSSSSFTVNFTATVDSVPYRASIVYADITHVRLYLYNSSGALVFDSYST